MPRDRSTNFRSGSEPADILLVDDRYINQHPHIAANERVTPIVTTLDLLDHLREHGELSDADVFGYRTALRQFGYQIVPVTQAELGSHLMAAPMVAGVLVETAELKAIREALLRARMSKMLQIPLELPAMQETQLSIMRLMHEVWLTSESDVEAEARADWLLRLSDIRLWASATQKGNERNFAVFGYAEYLSQLVIAPIGVDKGRRERYFAWLTERILNRVKDTQPEVFSRLIAKAKELIANGVEAGMKEQP